MTKNTSDFPSHWSSLQQNMQQNTARRHPQHDFGSGSFSSSVSCLECEFSRAVSGDNPPLSLSLSSIGSGCLLISGWADSFPFSSSCLAADAFTDFTLSSLGTAFSNSYNEQLNVAN
ncbi:hypothetical protein PMAYCL1PPCAC_10303 [Pristionchus mayeri]|uniref:Uncharacterized protein n=1 Tax=Pristionchus mayeri TaxID=1317129 RepID=A0AAN4ZKK9_9BILA|nr:hypothetical protein PMAYCL1PPCAC_10303 [Pristionchus mayeri]